MPFGSFWRNELLDHAFGKGAYSPPTIYLALSTADPGVDGATIAEPVGNNYSRKATAAADWQVAANGAIQNVTELVCPVATQEWGIIAYLVAFDAPTGGNFLFYDALGTPRMVTTGQTPRFPIGSCVVSLT